MCSEASVYLSCVKWDDSGHQLNEFAREYEFPQIGKIIKGQYMNVGVPSLSSPSLNQIVFWAMGGKRVKVIAQCVRFKEGRNSSVASNGRVLPVGPKLAIPDNYDGWWEILSEEGKSVRCIESIVDLAKRCPETCLVRENIKAHIGKQDDPNVVSDKVRTIQTGELLTLTTPDIVMPNTKSNSVRYLRCQSSKGDTVYLNMDQRGKFSPVAKEDNISGVHTITNLLSKRLPLMVRLVHGKPPQGFKNFHSDMRLFSSFEEECFVAMPLLKDTQSIIQVPISSGLKVLGPKNSEELCKLKEFSALHEMSKKLMQDLTDKIQVLDIQTLSKDLKDSLKDESKGKFAIKFQGHQHDHKRRLQSNFLVKRSLSDPQQLVNQNLKSSEELRRGSSLEDNKSIQCIKDEVNNENDQNNQCYDEIDQIYDYVRGFAPLPERIKSDFDGHKALDPLKASILNNENRPEPPPIITIPSIQNKRMSYPMASQKVSVNSKKVNKIMPRDHILGKSNKNEVKIPYFPNVRIPCRTNSANPIYLPTTPQPNYQSNNGPKLFIKSSSGQRNTWKSNRFLRYAKHVSSPFRNDSPNDTGLIQQKDLKSKDYSNNKTCRSSRSLTTSPIFNIRYKSMNNLHFIAPPGMDFNNTLESSNSGQTSSGSGSKDLFRDPKPKFPKLSRSLTNIFWDMTGNFIAIENMDKINNELNNRKNKNAPQIPLLPVHLDFLNALDRLQQQQNKEQNSKSRQLATLYL